MLAAQGDHRRIGQVFDEDLADLRHSAPPIHAAAILRLNPRRGGASVLVCLSAFRRGQSRSEVVGAKQTQESAYFHMRFPCEPTSVPQARTHLRDWCHEARIRGDVVADVQLAVTEAAANAVRHSDCADFEIQGRMSGATLIVLVWDQGRGRGDPEPGAGLGTGIICALADSVEFEDTQPGTRVTMCFPGIYL